MNSKSLINNIKKIKLISIIRLAISIASIIIIIPFILSLLRYYTLNNIHSEFSKKYIAYFIFIFILTVSQIVLWIIELIYSILLITDKNEEKYKSVEDLILALGICAIIPLTGGLVSLTISLILLKKINNIDN